MQVWEVSAQMLGLALSVGALRSIEAAHLPGAALVHAGCTHM